MFKLTQITAISAVLLLLPNFTPATAEPNFPAVACEEVWKGARPQDYLFDYLKDTSSSSRGNMGYRSYLNRVESSGLTPRRECYKSWTVLIYMAVSNDLLNYAYSDLLEMESGDSYDGISLIDNPTRGSSLRSDVIVQLETDTSSKIERLHMFQTLENGYSHLSAEDVSKLSRAYIQSPIVSHFERTRDENEKDRFSHFIKWAMQEYPSEHYLLIVWGHGQGWTSVESNPKLANQVSTVPRTSTDSKHSISHLFRKFFGGKYGGLGLGESGYLDIPGIQSVLQDVKEWSGGQPIDIFAPDSCLFLEAADVTQLANCTKYVCGSANIESYAGFPYGSLLVHLNSDRHFNGATDSTTRVEGEDYNVAWMIPLLYKQSFMADTGTQRDIDPRALHYLTGSAISTRHFLRSLLPSLDNLGLALVAFIEEETPRWFDIKEAIQGGLFYQGGTQDLGYFLRKLEILVDEDVRKHESKITTATQSVLIALKKTRLALNDSIINFALGDEYTPSPDPLRQSGPKGFAIWLPERDDEYQLRIADYSNSLFFQRQGWKKFMQKMYPYVP